MRSIFLKAVLVTATFVVISSCTHSRTESAVVNATGVKTVGKIKSHDVAEASGIVVSRINPDILWMNNDSFNKSSVYAVDTSGKVRAEIRVLGKENIDWEDLAYFEQNGKSYILVADAGDNDENRKKSFIYAIEEPVLKKSHSKRQVFNIKPSWSLSFTYPDGAHDVESVAVDPSDNKILLLSKRDFPPELYQLPLHEGKNVIAERLGEIKTLPKPKDLHFRIIDILGLTSIPTGMDISSDGQQLAIMTYGNAFIYKKSPEHSWIDILKETPQVTIPLPELKQGEAIGFDGSGEHVYITTEKLPAPIIDVDIKQLESQQRLAKQK
ncbi:hypothetical protein EES38_03430 [Vibrio viridaestus]|uniref:Lipoprotein n=2 Tax=Vibrio viridaestus TaxID=2487322 RepID=A0A3N9TL28_9VIBR|nr:hypothetical protein EES38_03430 [Vibrio viridaestus]